MERGRRIALDLPKETDDVLDKLATKEFRNRTDMARVLVMEAIEARQSQHKPSPSSVSQ